MGGRFFPGQYPFFDFSPDQNCYPPRNSNLRSFWPTHLGAHPFDPFSHPVSGSDPFDTPSSFRSQGRPGGNNRREPYAADGRGGVQKGRVITIPVQDGRQQQQGDVSTEVSSSKAGERIGIATAPMPASHQASPGVDVAHQVPKRPKQGIEPVHMDSLTAAVKIQACFRGYNVRRCKPSLRIIAGVKKRVRELQSEIEKSDVKCRIQENEKERLKYTEGLMALLLQLDSIQGVHPDIRDLRKAMTRQVIQLQEGMDCIIAGSTQPLVETNTDEAMEQQASSIPECGSNSVEAMVVADADNHNASESMESNLLAATFNQQNDKGAPDETCMQERVPLLEGSTITSSETPIEAHTKELDKTMEDSQISSEACNGMQCEGCNADNHHENCNATGAVSACRL